MIRIAGLVLMVLVCNVARGQFIEKVRTPPLIKDEADQSIAYKIGESIKLECLASGVPKPKYSWKKDGRDYDVSGNDNRVTQQPNAGTIVINNPMKKDEGTYQCFANNKAGIAATQKFILRSAQLDEFQPVEKPPILTGMVGSPLSLRCSPPKSIPRAEVFWVKVSAEGAMENVVMSNRVSMDSYGSLHFANLLPSDQLEPGARYQCAVSNKEIRGINFGADAEIHVTGTTPMGAPPRVLWSTADNRPIALAGTVFSLKCIFSGMPTPRVEWRRVDGKMGPHITKDSFGQELVFRGVKFEDAGRYECEGYNTQAGNPARKPFDLRIESKPFWVQKPVSAMRGEHENVTLHCEAAGQPTPVINWFINGKPVEKAAANPRRQVLPNSITYTDLHLSDTEVVQCNASNIHGYSFTNAYVTVLKVPPVWTVPPPPRVAFSEGQTVNVSCQTQAAPAATVAWTKDGTPLTGGRFKVQTDGNLLIRDLVSTDAGQYECTATNRYGNITATSDVYVRRATRIVRRPESLWVNAGTEAKFICTALTDPENMNALEIVWYRDRRKNGTDIGVRKTANVGKPINYAKSQRFLQNLRDNSLTITDVKIQDTAWYTCVGRTNSDSAEATAYLKVRAPPNMPVITKVDCTTMQSELKAVVWFHPDGSNYVPIRAYRIQYATSFTPDQWITGVEMQDNIKNTKVEVQMTPFANYTFRVLARNRLGWSKPSNASAETCTTQPAPPSRNPINVRVRGTTPTNLVIMWTIMIPIEHNGLGFKYVVTWECVDKKCEISPDRYRGQSEVSNYLQDRLVIENQLTYQKYRVQVTAENEQGTAGTAEPVYGYSGSNAPSVAPTHFRVDENSIRSTSATVRWKPVPNDPRVIRGELKGYVVKFAFHVQGQRQRSIKMATFFFDHIEHTNATYIPTEEPTTPAPPPPPGPDRGDLPGEATAAPTAESATTIAPARYKRSVVSMTEEEMVVVVENLPAFTEVDLTVAAVNEAYMGPESGIVTITTKEGLPGPVGYLYAKRRLSNRVILAWDPPDEPNGVITQYMVAHREIHGLNLREWDWDPVVTDPEVRLSSVSGLKPSQNYRFYVYAVTAVGRGEANFIDVATISPGMPTPPTFSIVEVTDHYMNVSWEPSRSGNPGSVFYVQFKKTGRPNWDSSRVETLHNWLNLTMLSPGTYYQIRVVARNGMDQEAATWIQTVKTTGFSARLDLILGHPWFICLLFFCILIGILLCGIRWWKKNKPLPYPDPYEKTALNPDEYDFAPRGSVDAVANRGYDSTPPYETVERARPMRPPVGPGAPHYATVNKDKGRLRSATESAVYGDPERPGSYPTHYAPRSDPDPPEVFAPQARAEGATLI